MSQTPPFSLGKKSLRAPALPRGPQTARRVQLIRDPTAVSRPSSMSQTPYLAWEKNPSARPHPLPAGPKPSTPPPSSMAARVAKQAARASGTAAPCRLLELPEELLLRVLQHLGMAALQAAGSAWRGSGEFWAPLAFSEPARSRIQRLLPRAAEGGPPTIGALRLFFSGTQPVARDVGEMYLYGTVERGGDVVATFGPVDADLVETDIGESRYRDWTTLKTPLDWKSAAVKKEYSDDDAPGWPKETLLKKSVTVSTYAVTESGTWLAKETSIKAGTKPVDTALDLTLLIFVNKPASIVSCMIWNNLNVAGLWFQIADNDFEPFSRALKGKGQQTRAAFQQIRRHFRPTHREIVEVA
jgi:hypothetical protein